MVTHSDRVTLIELRRYGLGHRFSPGEHQLPRMPLRYNMRVDLQLRHRGHVIAQLLAARGMGQHVVDLAFSCRSVAVLYVMLLY